VIVYTAILNDFDRLLAPRVRDEEIHYVCFTDMVPSDANGWEIHPVERTQEHPRLQQRSYKILSHRQFRAAGEVTLYIDGNFELLVDPRYLAEEYLTSSDLALFRHPERNGIFAELDACAELAKDNPRVLAEVAARYRRHGVPEVGFLHAGGFILRRHTQSIGDFNEAWYGELQQTTFRDQPALAYTLWRTGLKHATIEGNIWHNDLLKYHAHNQNEGLSPSANRCFSNGPGPTATGGPST
jgi:Protein of unknown function (DUF616)